MSRKLATVRKIGKLIPIKGADFIELALVDGWQCIVKKGEFEVGDKGIYFEIDSMLPLDEKYSFLGKSTNDNTAEGYRIKTMKMRKQLSQGLMLPFHMFDSELKFSGRSITGTVGFDMTEKLGVWLYEPLQRQGTTNTNSVGRQGKQRGLFPSFIPKTDQERIQNCMHYFDTYKGDVWEATLKLDGSSITIWNYDKAPHLMAGKSQYLWKNKWLRLKEKVKSWFFPPSTFGVCSRNINLEKIEGNSFWDMAIKYDMEAKLKGYNVAVQGELIGPKIQDNYEKVVRNDMFIYDVYDIDKGRYMKAWERLDFLDDIGMSDKMVPVVDEAFEFDVHAPDFDALQEYVTRDGMNKGVRAEGVVFKNIAKPELSFKCVSNAYLLKEK